MPKINKCPSYRSLLSRVGQCRRAGLFLLVGAFAMSGVRSAESTGPVSENKQPPNVVFIVVDDLNDFPAFLHGYPDAKTPNLDRLAERGVVFTRAHAQFPLCGPSRASFMSGLLPSTLGFDGHMQDAEVEKRVRELGTELLHTRLARHGYKTMAVGKILHNHVSKGSVDASGGRLPFNEGTGRLRRNWDVKGTQTDWAAAPERDEDLADHKSATWAVKQLQKKQDNPFFLMVGFLRPHVPWYVPQQWFDLYDKEAIALPPYKADDLDDLPEIAKRISILPQYPKTDWAIENDQWRNILHAYLACTSFVDHQVGRVLKALEASPYRDNTIVVLFSDNGYHLGEKNTFQKETLWERSSRVPLIIAGPEVEVGRSDRVVSLLDLYPTLLDLCGLPANEKNEGHSLLPLLRDLQSEWSHPSIIGYRENSFAVQGERYRYFRYGDGSEELYDHHNDPNEWANLAADPDLRGIKQKMAGYLPQAEKN
jgi:arylsulfatase A-like enzyme